VFATLLGGMPNPPSDHAHAAGIDARVEAVVRAQEAARLEPITDGRIRTPDLLDLAVGLDRVTGSAATRLTARGLPRWSMPLTLDAWQATAALTDRAVKQALPGPYTLGRRVADPRSTSRDELTMAFADAIHHEVDSLAAAGCPLVEIEETDAHLIGDDESERQLFREAHRRLMDGVQGTHLSLSIVGGSADGAGAETILDAPYHSLAVDLIAGPDNWRLVARAPSDRGIVAGALSSSSAGDEGPEVLLWAAHYAASTAGRGLVRIGLGTAGGLDQLPWLIAVRKLEALGKAAELAAMSPSEQLARSLDPRAVSSRRAALGHGAPSPPRRGTRRP
jgi:methionine synthase II (cobalamin-independent)